MIFSRRSQGDCQVILSSDRKPTPNHNPSNYKNRKQFKLKPNMIGMMYAISQILGIKG